LLLIDKYAYINGLRDYNPKFKILISLGGLIILRIINITYLYIINIILMLVLTIGIAKISVKDYMKVFKIPMFFLMLSIIMIIISINDTSYIYSIKLGNINIGITKESIGKGIELYIGVISSLTSIYFLILTTSIVNIISGLKNIGIPSLIIELMVLIYRSIFLFIEEANNIHLGQSIKFGYINKKNSLRSLSLLISSLFTRVLIRHKKMNIALECKLYDGEFRLGD